MIFQCFQTRLSFFFSYLFPSQTPLHQSIDVILQIYTPSHDKLFSPSWKYCLPINKLSLLPTPPTQIIRSTLGWGCPDLLVRLAVMLADGSGWRSTHSFLIDADRHHSVILPGPLVFFRRAMRPIHQHVDGKLACYPWKRKVWWTTGFISIT